jgi:cytochrome b561
MVMEIVLFISPLLLAILGLIIRSGKASFLIAGYNTSSKEEKDKYDEKALCRFVGNLLLVLAVIHLAIAIWKVLNFDYFNYVLGIGFTLFIVVTIAAVIYMNTGNRFKK